MEEKDKKGKVSLNDKWRKQTMLQPLSMIPSFQSDSFREDIFPKNKIYEYNTINENRLIEDKINNNKNMELDENEILKSNNNDSNKITLRGKDLERLQKREKKINLNNDLEDILKPKINHDPFGRKQKSKPLKPTAKEINTEQEYLDYNSRITKDIDYKSGRNRVQTRIVRVGNNDNNKNEKVVDELLNNEILNETVNNNTSNIILNNKDISELKKQEEYDDKAPLLFEKEPKQNNYNIPKLEKEYKILNEKDNLNAIKINSIINPYQTIKNNIDLQNESNDLNLNNDFKNIKFINTKNDPKFNSNLLLENDNSIAQLNHLNDLNLNENNRRNKNDLERNFIDLKDINQYNNINNNKNINGLNHLNQNVNKVMTRLNENQREENLFRKDNILNNQRNIENDLSLNKINHLNNNQINEDLFQQNNLKNKNNLNVNLNKSIDNKSKLIYENENEIKSGKVRTNFNNYQLNKDLSIYEQNIKNENIEDKSFINYNNYNNYNNNNNSKSIINKDIKLVPEKPFIEINDTKFINDNFKFINEGYSVKSNIEKNNIVKSKMGLMQENENNHYIKNNDYNYKSFNINENQNPIIDNNISDYVNNNKLIQTREKIERNQNDKTIKLNADKSESLYTENNDFRQSKINFNNNLNNTKRENKNHLYENNQFDINNISNINNINNKNYNLLNENEDFKMKLENNQTWGDDQFTINNLSNKKFINKTNNQKNSINDLNKEINENNILNNINNNIKSEWINPKLRATTEGIEYLKENLEKISIQSRLRKLKEEKKYNLNYNSNNPNDFIDKNDLQFNIKNNNINHLNNVNLPNNLNGKFDKNDVINDIYQNNNQRLDFINYKNNLETKSLHQSINKNRKINEGIDNQNIIKSNKRIDNIHLNEYKKNINGIGNQETFLEENNILSTKIDNKTFLSKNNKNIELNYQPNDLNQNQFKTIKQFNNPFDIKLNKQKISNPDYQYPDHQTIQKQNGFIPFPTFNNQQNNINHQQYDIDKKNQTLIKSEKSKHKNIKTEFPTEYETPIPPQDKINNRIKTIKNIVIPTYEEYQTEKEQDEFIITKSKQSVKRHAKQRSLSNSGNELHFETDTEAELFTPINSQKKIIKKGKRTKANHLL